VARGKQQQREALTSPTTARPSCPSLTFVQPVVDDDSSILGVVTEGNITSRLLAGRVKPADSVSQALYAQFRRVTVATTLSELARIFDRDHFAVVVQTQRTYRGGDAATMEKSVVVGVVSRIDLLKYITSHGPQGAGGSA